MLFINVNKNVMLFIFLKKDSNNNRDKKMWLDYFIYSSWDNIINRLTAVFLYNWPITSSFKWKTLNLDNDQMRWIAYHLMIIALIKTINIERSGNSMLLYTEVYNGSIACINSAGVLFQRISSGTYLFMLQDYISKEDQLI